MTAATPLRVALLIGHYRNASAAGGDDTDSGGDHIFDRLFPLQFVWVMARQQHDASRVPHLPKCPSHLFAAGHSFRSSIKRANGLGRILKSGVVSGNFNLGNDGGELPFKPHFK